MQNNKDKQPGKLVEPSPNQEDAKVISQFLKFKNTKKLKTQLNQWNDREIAKLAAFLPITQYTSVFELLSDERAANVSTHLLVGSRQNLWANLTNEKLLRLLVKMEPDDRRFILESVEPDRRSALLRRMNSVQRRETEVLMSYPEQSVGRLMTPKCLRIRPEWTVSKVINHIRKYGKDTETFEVLFVTDEKGYLTDEINLREIILASSDTRVLSIMDKKFVSINAREDQELAIQVMEKHDLSVLPVVDDHQKLLGIITFDDVMDVAEVEASEDIEKLSGMEALGDRYSGVSILRLFRKRVVWLVILFFGGLLTILAMGNFQEKIQQNAVLALFIPLIIACGGNTGTQTASLMVRALALDDVQPRNWLQVLRRELANGILLGSVLGLLGFLVGAVTVLLFEAQHSPGVLGLAIGSAVGGVVLCGAFVGSMLPFVFDSFGVDPATSSAPAVTTVLDVTGLLVYFSIASLIL